MGSDELHLNMVSCGQDLAEHVVGLLADQAPMGISLSLYERESEFFESLPKTNPLTIVVYLLDSNSPIPNPFVNGIIERQPTLPVICLSDESHSFLDRIPAGNTSLLVDFLSTTNLSYEKIWSSIKGLFEKQKLTSALKETHHKLELMQQEYSSTELSAGMAHDANNALAAVIGHLKKAERLIAQSQESEIGRALRSAIAGCHHVSALMHDHVALVKNENVSEKKIVSVRTLVQETCQVAETLIPSNIKLHYRAPEGLSISGEKHQLQRALINLVLNAVQATTGSGTISIEAEYLLHDGKDSIQLSVRDQGEGIPPQILPRIFDPFFSTKKQDGGSGLGLALVSRIVAEHSGDLYVTSELGKGTEFRIVLPESEPEQRAVSQPQPETKVLEVTGNILLVDDSEELLEVTTDILEEANLTVIPFADPLAAVCWFEEHASEVDLVLLDMQLPGLSGYEVQQRLRVVDPNALIVIYSGVKDERVETALSDGAKHFLKKPLDYDQACDLLKGFIAEAQQ